MRPKLKLDTDEGKLTIFGVTYSLPDTGGLWKGINLSHRLSTSTNPAARKKLVNLRDDGMLSHLDENFVSARMMLVNGLLIPQTISDFPWIYQGGRLEITPDSLYRLVLEEQIPMGHCREYLATFDPSRIELRPVEITYVITRGAYEGTSMVTLIPIVCEGLPCNMRLANHNNETLLDI